MGDKLAIFGGSPSVTIGKQEYSIMFDWPIIWKFMKGA